MSVSISASQDFFQRRSMCHRPQSMYNQDRFMYSRSRSMWKHLPSTLSRNTIGKDRGGTNGIMKAAIAATETMSVTNTMTMTINRS